MKESSSSFNSVEKALKVLLLLTPRSDGLGTSQLSEELGFTLPTVSRLLHTLAKHDFVQKHPEGKKYVLGKAALDLGRFAHKHVGAQLAAIARPHIDALRDAVEESAILEVMAGDDAYLAYRANGPHAVGIAVTAGMRVPAHVSPGAKAILAHSSPEATDRILAGGLHRFTPRTITDPEAFRRNLQEVKRKGVAFASGEYNLEIAAMGAPIFNYEKKPVAGVVITMPSYRVKAHRQAELVRRIKDTARKISEQLLHYKI
ncbi:MAG: IclR family transcriptional regulator [Thermodesulfobacteriota bacterium]